MDRLQILRQVTFGSQVAEEEVRNLQDYFVQTDQWDKIFRGDVDIIRGEKGSGKSAIYLLLGKNKEDLFDRGIVTVNGENPRGTTVFKDLVAAPPTSEQEFVLLWKIYLLVIVCHELRSLGVNDGEIKGVYGVLEEAELLEVDLNLAGLLRSAQNFARRLLGISSIEGGVELDQSTLMPTGIVGKISLSEPTGKMRSTGITSVDGLFRIVNDSLVQAKYSVWVLLDRLDVAFAESHALEANAIRALIRVYGDMRALDNISLKVFLREDIWRRITEGGFREASHITRFVVMNWTPPLLLNLIMTRLLSNDALVAEFGINKKDVLSDSKKQDMLFLRVFPPQVEQGPQKATTFNWMMTRCADATGKTAPRELIHLLNCIRDEEVRRLERGGAPAPNEHLFDRSVFKQALPTVSETRLNTYLYAEFPAERPFLEKLRGEKAEQTPDSLASMWGVSREEAQQRASELSALGFFEIRGSRSEPSYWVPFLYRDALGLIQGKADLE